MLPIPFTRPDTRASRSAEALHVEVVTDPQAFAALRTRWNALLGESRSDCVFLTWEWLSAWWTHLAGDRSLNILLAWDRGELVGIAPLVRSRGSLPWLSRLEFLGTGFAGSDYLDLIVRPDLEREVAHAFADALRRSSDTLHLDHLPPDSIAASTLVDPLSAGSWTTMQAEAGTCPYIPLAGYTWDSYLGSIGSAHRANFRRRLRALDRQFAVRFLRVRTDDERREGLETLISLHNRRWDTRGGSTAFPTTECRAFHYDVTRLALQRGWLRLYELRLNDEIVAATYCFTYAGRCFFYQGAFDDRYQQHSVGMVAMGLTIKAAVEEGASEFDMLFGVESYKWLWARHARTLHRIDLFPSDLAGRVHHGTARATRSARTMVRRIFPRKSCTSNTPPAGAVC
jgi:CelD/BcsL family acetyltransferase involved in cellulose biosynthesis